jgi:hypothetical protein
MHAKRHARPLPTLASHAPTPLTLLPHTGLGATAQAYAQVSSTPPYSSAHSPRTAPAWGDRVSPLHQPTYSPRSPRASSPGHIKAQSPQSPQSPRHTTARSPRRPQSERAHKDGGGGGGGGSSGAYQHVPTLRDALREEAYASAMTPKSAVASPRSPRTPRSPQSLRSSGMLSIFVFDLLPSACNSRDTYIWRPFFFPCLEW